VQMSLGAVCTKNVKTTMQKHSNIEKATMPNLFRTSNVRTQSVAHVYAGVLL